jgi:Amt family ammonium transporter
MRNRQRLAQLLGGAGLFAAPVLALAAEEAATKSTLHLAWLGVCAILVFFMQAGFALVESGVARAKNAVNVVMKNFTDTGTSTLGYWLAGYGLMFGASYAGWVGTSYFAPTPSDGAMAMNIVYQMMFAATASTIMSGAVAERMRFGAYVFAACITSVVIYPVFGAWAWGGSGETLGWLRDLGFIDAAGSTVVHSIGGWSALAAVLVLGPRMGRFSRKGESREIPGHNLPMFALGAFILWFGWNGFNGGAAKSDFSDLGLILLNTNLGGAAGMVGAMLTMFFTRTPLLLTNSVNGALGGLVSVTAGCTVMDPAFAMLAGLIGGSVVILGSRLLDGARIDDVVGAIPVHAFCGVWGTLAVGLFHTGDLFSLERLTVQIIGVVAAFVWSFGTSWVVFKLIDVSMGLRASSMHEQRGLDISEHYEVGYSDFVQASTHGGKGA